MPNAGGTRGAERAKPYDHGMCTLCRTCACCVEKEREIERLQTELSNLVLKHGGKNAGHVYGPANCWACKSLTSDYLFVGKTQLCLECFDAFPNPTPEEARRE